MSAFKFKVGEPKEVILAFDKPKEGTNTYGNWYLYGVKTDINSDEEHEYQSLDQAYENFHKVKG